MYKGQSGRQRQDEGTEAYSGHGQLRDAGHDKGPEPAGVGMKASSGDGTWQRRRPELLLVAPGVPGEAAAVDLAEEDGSGRSFSARGGD